MSKFTNRAAEVAAITALAALVGCASSTSKVSSDAEIGTSGHVISAAAAQPGALNVGDKAPNFKLPSDRGGSIELNDLLKDGPVVLTFYRGEWCPYCNRALAGLQEAHPQIRQLGAEVVAISPQNIKSSTNSRDNNNLDYIILSDPGNEVAADFGVAFQLPDNLLNTYKNSYGIDLAKFNDNADSSLPLATLYVIDQDRKIKYAFVTDDHSKRADTDEVIKALQSL